MREYRDRLEEFDRRELFDLLKAHIVGNFPGRFECNFALPAHARCRPQEVDIVRIVERRIKALRIALGDIVLVHFRGLHIGFGGIIIAPDTPEDVGRHVHEMA